MNRYYRCQNDYCRRKWHHTSVARLAPIKIEVRSTDLLDAIPPTEFLCPACRGKLVPEKGLMDEGAA